MALASLSPPLLRQLIFPHLSTRDLLRLTRVCKGLRTLVRDGRTVRLLLARLDPSFPLELEKRGLVAASHGDWWALFVDFSMSWIAVVEAEHIVVEGGDSLEGRLLAPVLALPNASAERLKLFQSFLRSIRKGADLVAVHQAENRYQYIVEAVCKLEYGGFSYEIDQAYDETTEGQDYERVSARASCIAELKQKITQLGRHPTAPQEHGVPICPALVRLRLLSATDILQIAVHDLRRAGPGLLFAAHHSPFGPGLLFPELRSAVVFRHPRMVTVLSSDVRARRGIPPFRLTHPTALLWVPQIWGSIFPTLHILDHYWRLLDMDGCELTDLLVLAEHSAVRLEIEPKRKPRGGRKG